MSSSPVPLPEVKDAILEINNGLPYSATNVGPILNIGDLAPFVKLQKIKDGKFRISALNFFLYYPNFLGDKEEMKTFYISLRQTNECIISHNHGNTYVFLNFGNPKGSEDKVKPFASSVVNVFDFKELRPEIYAFTRDGIKYSKNWIQRADPSFVPCAMQGKQSMYDQLKDCENKIDVLKKCYQASDVSGKVQAWDIIQNEKGFTDEYIVNYKPWGWQLDMYQKVQYTGDDRKIDWYWNNIPKLGKSTIGYYLMVKHPKYFYVISNPSYAKDTATVLLSAMENGWNGHTIIINLTMTYDGLDWLYGVLESIKDPIFSASKYRGRTVVKGMTNVVVFSNFEPNPYHSKTGKMLIDPDRIEKVKIPEPIGIIDPNPPRIRHRTAELPDLEIRPEDKIVMEYCRANAKLGSDVAHMKENTKKEDPKCMKFLENVKMPEAVPLPEVVVHTPVVKEMVKKIEKKPYDEEAKKWKTYLNKEEGSLNSKGNVVQAWQILLNKGTSVGDRDLIVCKEEEYKNYRHFKEGTNPVADFYKNYYRKLPEAQRCLFEVITNRPQKIFFDIDIPRDMSDWHEGMLIAQIQLAILKVEPEIKKENIMLFSSHGSTKRSYHIVVDKFFVVNNYANQDFFLEVKSLVDPNLRKPMDESVYKKVQQLRMYGCQKYDQATKTGCGRIKILSSKSTWVNEEKDTGLKDYNTLRCSLITHDTGCKLLRRKVEEKPGYEGVNKDYSLDEIEKMKNLVKEKFGSTFEHYGENKNSLIFKRMNPSMCPIHNRVHEKQNISVYVENGSNKVYYRCFNIKKEDSVKKYEIGCI